MTPTLQMCGSKILSLLISLAIMHNPTCDMPTLWVMVRPMDDAAFFVPDILTIKANAIPYLQSGDARRDVDVVCNQQRLSRCKLNDESLVSQSVPHRPAELESPYPRL
jgi:hypothetical protein